MLLVEDQYVQNSRKNFDTEFQVKQNTSKQVFSDPKDIWKIESGCEEVNSSGNDSEEEENLLYADPSDLPEEVFNPRKTVVHRKKNVRFGSPGFDYVFETSETSSLDNEYLGIDRGYVDTTHRRLSQDPDLSHKLKDSFRMTHKTKCRSPDCGCDKFRPKSTPDNLSNYLDSIDRRALPIGDYDPHRTRKNTHRCNHHHGDFDFEDLPYKKPPHRPHKYACGDDLSSRCCDHCPNEPRTKTNFLKLKPTPAPTPGHKYVYHTLRDPEPDPKPHRKLRPPDPPHYDPSPYHPPPPSDRYPSDDYYDHPYKSKKNTLEAVQEQQEHFSDSTYKVPCNKFSSQTISGELLGFQRKRSSEKFTNSSQSDRLYHGGKGTGVSAGDRLAPPRMHKMRSRRTRMNRLKNGWKKAFVQTVRDGSRNERVGVIVMGSKGPEFYSKNSEKSPNFVPFRRSKSFLDGPAKSFEVMTVDCKNVFLSSSEPGPRRNYAMNDLVCPEDDDKVEDTIAKFSKNVNEIVKSNEEKFYKALSSSEYPEKKKAEEEAMKEAEEGGVEEKKVSSEVSGRETESGLDGAVGVQEEKKEEQKSKYPPFHLLPLSSMSPRVPKSLRKAEKVISEGSKAMANALNEQAKQYLENQSSHKDKEESFLEELEELQERFTPKESNPERADGNLSLWTMNLGHLSGRAEGSEMMGAREGKAEAKEEKERTGQQQSHTGSMKSTEQISLNKQRRKKYYESTTSGAKGEEGGEGGGESKPESATETPKGPKALPKGKSASPSCQRRHSLKEADSSLISAVFRDLVENGCAISQEESENLQSIFNEVTYNAEVCSNGAMSTMSSEGGMETRREEGKLKVTGRSVRSGVEGGGGEGCKEKGGRGRELEYLEEEEECKGREVEEEEEYERVGREEELEEVNSRKVVKMSFLDKKFSKKVQSKHKEGKSKKKGVTDDKMKLLREALPSIAAENEATHLKQLKRYIDRFIDRVEASTTPEFCSRKDHWPKSKAASSTDSSEIRVDARKILEFVSNPFRKISSDVTINIAKKLTDALVQDKATRCPKHSPAPPNPRRHSDNDTDHEPFLPPRTRSRSPSSATATERCEEPEPTYLKQLKKMRNEHLNNIVLEVKRLSELLRFLDRCNRLHF